MSTPRKYPQELRDRAQRLVVEARNEEPGLSLNAAVVRIGKRVGVNADTLRGWCKQAAIDDGRAAGTTSSDSVQLRDPEREVRELKRANEILLLLSLTTDIAHPPHDGRCDRRSATKQRHATAGPRCGATYCGNTRASYR